MEHEVWDYSVEEDVAVVSALDEGTEVFAGLLVGLAGFGGGGRGEEKYLGGVVVVELYCYDTLYAVLKLKGGE